MVDAASRRLPRPAVKQAVPRFTQDVDFVMSVGTDDEAESIVHRLQVRGYAVGMPVSRGFGAGAAGSWLPGAVADSDGDGGADLGDGDGGNWARAAKGAARITPAAVITPPVTVRPCGVPTWVPARCPYRGRRMRRNSAVPSLASDPKKPYPLGPVM